MHLEVTFIKEKLVTQHYSAVGQMVHLTGVHLCGYYSISISDSGRAHWGNGSSIWQWNYLLELKGLIYSEICANVFIMLNDKKILKYDQELDIFKSWTAKAYCKEKFLESSIRVNTLMAVYHCLILSDNYDVYCLMFWTKKNRNI